MRIFICILAIITNSITAFTQVNFKTIVPEDPVIIGEAFPVQYVLENVPSDTKCIAPSFKNFKLVSGPSVYTGNTGYPLKNTVYTLVAIKPGKFVIEGAGIDYNGTAFKSNNAVVEVITEAEAFKRGILKGEALSNSDLYLKPGEDPYKKISNNLFVKLVTDKHSCYVGEPVTATFKLYSRLQSTSDIVKNPGFYGFGVYDVWGVKDNKTVKETINGKQYDVHIIRKVQLYPLKAGSLTIDEMEIENMVVFTDSHTLRKAEQLIIEGVIADKKNKGKKPGTHEYISSIHTDPVTINVKAIPAANKPADYAGGTGQFTINAELSKNEIAVNEEAALIVTISGRGNFTQLTAPSIQWPAGVEGSEPSVVDSLDNSFSPLKGKRIFHYPFVASKGGDFVLPSVQFSFFNPDTNAYKQVKTKPINFSVKQKSEIKSDKPHIKKGSSSFYLYLAIAIVSLIAVALFVFLWRKKKLNSIQNHHKAIPEKPSTLSISTILQPAFAAIQSSDPVFYSSVRQCIWSYFSDRFGVSTTMNNGQLLSAIKGKTNEALKHEVEELLTVTETYTYGGISSANDKKDFYQRTLSLLEKIDAGIEK